MITSIQQEGDRICTVARDGARIAKLPNGLSIPIWTGAIYEAKRRRDDRVLTWRRVGSFGGTRATDEPSRAFEDHLKAEAEHQWVDMDSVWHGRLANF